MDAATAAPIPSVDQLRRWLSQLHRPDRLADPELVELLGRHGRLPEPATPLAVGEAAAALLASAIDRLRPPAGASREEQRLYDVLYHSFVKRSTTYQAAHRLGLSERQVTRDRTRALRLLEAELAAPAVARPAATASADEPAYQLEPIPAILDYLPRPRVSAALVGALGSSRLVHVHGPRGIGKTSLVAETAWEAGTSGPVFWYHFRPGVNDSLGALLYELGEHLRAYGRTDLATHLATSGDVRLATRVALRALTGHGGLVVLDDFHAVAGDAAITGFVVESVRRLADLRVVTVERQRGRSGDDGTTIEVPPLSADETNALMAHLGVETDRDLTATIHAWTGGVPQLVKLAVSWLVNATPAEVASFTSTIGEVEEVQDFLLDSITELISSDDRAILDAASIFRDRFTDHALAYVSERARGTVQDAGHRLVRAYVVSRSRHGDVAFLHGTVREYIRARLSPERAAGLHRRAAAWYVDQSLHDEADFHRAAADAALAARR